MVVLCGCQGEWWRRDGAVRAWLGVNMVVDAAMDGR